VRNLREVVLETYGRAYAWALPYKRYWPAVGAVMAVVLIYGVSKACSPEVVYQIKREGEFKESRILGSPFSTVIGGKEQLFAKHAQDLEANQGRLQEKIDTLTKSVAELSEKLNSSAPPPEKKEELATGAPTVPSESSVPRSDVRYHSGDSSIEPQAVRSEPANVFGPPRRSFASRGPQIVSFPVKEDEQEDKKPGVVLPSGSYVKAKVLTGVEAPEGKTYPVLVQLDFAYILPNHNRLDLAGCFMIAKATGNLSIERVEMQVTKMSCVSRKGEMFEREVNGFIADDKDNSFAVVGSVNSKQDRVAAMSFLASIVSGVSKAIQQAQTTQQVNPLGGSQSMMTGDQMKYIGAGGASEAATTVANWYLNQAQNLLPTINIGSGRDVWVIMQDSVSLPETYFKKGEDRDATYSYFTRMLN